MKKFSILLLCFIFSAAILSGAEIKFGFVDSQDVANAHPEYQMKMTEIEKSIQPMKDKLLAKQKELEAMYQEYEKNTTASDEIKRAAEAKIKKKQEDYQKFGSEYQYEIKKREAELLPQEMQKEILSEVMKAIEGVSKREGFQAIYDITKANLVYVEPSLDITERAKDELLRNLKDKTEVLKNPQGNEGK